jgi:homoserine dehydrogenase
MVNVAVLGYGVVGSGVVELIDKNNKLFTQKINQPIDVKYILDIRDFPGDKYEKKLVKDFNIILDDPEISVVVETIGGAKIAYELTKKALLAGKNVVTSNKELVAAKAPELLALAREKNVSYLFEGSVGGGIPIIRPLYHCLAANELKTIIGILNGTTNYILTKMVKEQMPFEIALQNAKDLGYAEKNPAADIEGHDTCRKICILASLAFGKHIYPQNVYTMGIQNLKLSDIEKAAEKGYVIKLLGSAAKDEDGFVDIFVSPCAIKNSHPLANIEDVFNGITVTGDAIGDVTFYGRGAGKFPTASAVGADIIDCIKDSHKQNILWVDSDNNFVRSFDKLHFKYLEGTDIPVIE